MILLIDSLLRAPAFRRFIKYCSFILVDASAADNGMSVQLSSVSSWMNHGSLQDKGGIGIVAGVLVYLAVVHPNFDKNSIIGGSGCVELVYIFWIESQVFTKYLLGLLLELSQRNMVCQCLRCIVTIEPHFRRWAAHHPPFQQSRPESSR